ncbi:hypothetical protein [unidentified bacterial endosymbiont]|jgi:hypothetical protein|uniref:hypothetical protein n=1 Tax=unidentified bacterial endosymbiont TaxID=2355 RepID=UPI00209E6A55|nr:hypothetical protein [unidentified bacterial endosymbiont]
MISQKRINAVGSGISYQNPIIVLTDNYWLYFGIAQLYPQTNVIHVRLSDEALHTKLWGNVNSVVLIVDNDIYIQGEWLSLLSIFDACTFVKIIWLQGDKTGAFTPFKPGKSYLVEKKKALLEFKRNLNDIFCGRESRTGKNRCTRLTKSECSMIKYLAAEHKVQSISEHASLSLKSIYHVRSTLMSKFGFENASFFQFILFKNIDILFPIFTNKIHTANARLIKQ